MLLTQVRPMDTNVEFSCSNLKEKCNWWSTSPYRHSPTCTSVQVGFLFLGRCVEFWSQPDCCTWEPWCSQPIVEPTTATIRFLTKSTHQPFGTGFAREALYYEPGTIFFSQAPTPAKNIPCIQCHGAFFLDNGNFHFIKKWNTCPCL